MFSLEKTGSPSEHNRVIDIEKLCERRRENLGRRWHPVKLYELRTGGLRFK